MQILTKTKNRHRLTLRHRGKRQRHSSGENPFTVGRIHISNVGVDIPRNIVDTASPQTGNAAYRNECAALFGNGR